MNTLETRFFNVFYEDADRNIIDRIVALIDGTYTEIVDRFGLKEDCDRFAFYLCPDVKTYTQRTGKKEEEYQEWMVGNAEYNEKRICILSPNVVTDRSFDDMLSVIRHEIVHIAFDQLGNADEVNLLLAEGIAVAVADQICLDELDETDYPEAKLLQDEDYFYDNGGYMYSGVYVLYFLKKYGTDVFKKLYAGEDNIDKYLYEGFELEAIKELIG